MQLEHLMTFRAEIGGSLAVGETPQGTRSIARVVGGKFEGPGLRGTILEPGADWVRFSADGFGQIDVRLVFLTDDGEHIYVHYEGLLELTEGFGQAMANKGSTEFGDNYFATQIRLEAGPGKYAHLNQVIAVGEGRITEGDVEYRCFKVVPNKE